MGRGVSTVGSVIRITSADRFGAETGVDFTATRSEDNVAVSFFIPDSVLTNADSVLWDEVMPRAKSAFTAHDQAVAK